MINKIKLSSKQIAEDLVRKLQWFEKFTQFVCMVVIHEENLKDLIIEKNNGYKSIIPVPVLLHAVKKRFVVQ